MHVAFYGEECTASFMNHASGWWWGYFGTVFCGELKKSEKDGSEGAMELDTEKCNGASIRYDAVLTQPSLVLQRPSTEAAPQTSSSNTVTPSGLTAAGRWLL